MVFNRAHAIFGSSERCVAVNPSDMCVALYALDAIRPASSKERTAFGAFQSAIFIDFPEVLRNATPI